MTLGRIIRQGISFGKKEFLLSIIVFAYLAVSYSVLSAGLSEGMLFLLQVFFILIENYVTVAVYYGIKQYLWEGAFDVKGMFAGAKHFFARTLYYKLLAGAAALFIAAFCLSMIEVVKDSSAAAAGLITGFTVIWISFPVYLVLLTFFAPLIIIAEDNLLLPSVRKSIVFVRTNFADVVKLCLLAAPLWFFAIFLMRVYNKKDLFLLPVIFYFIAVLEILTVKLFFLFYKARTK
ncbi:MAG: hypothetical protein JW957_01750 [Candidatus Omnitrophica bacterium]|nr:hypothetical protein [Candidatus Omnitrophota bacterium]